MSKSCSELLRDKQICGKERKEDVVVDVIIISQQLSHTVIWKKYGWNTIVRTIVLNSSCIRIGMKSNNNRTLYFKDRLPTT